jgi:hypothetical protein
MRLRDDYESLLILRVLNRGAGKTAIAAAKDSLAARPTGAGVKLLSY